MGFYQRDQQVGVGRQGILNFRPRRMLMIRRLLSVWRVLGRPGPCPHCGYDMRATPDRCRGVRVGRHIIYRRPIAAPRDVTCSYRSPESPRVDDSHRMVQARLRRRGRCHRRRHGADGVATWRRAGCWRGGRDRAAGSRPRRRGLLPRFVPGPPTARFACAGGVGRVHEPVPGVGPVAPSPQRLLWLAWSVYTPDAEAMR